ncbi:hydrolase [Peribacillus loiseleuriae]|uniref:Hydrolase n=1 Tax=Peribacillus loiseleuriae TaxID=1679170 RepID=A0A0K9H016_9BACI|nr:hydrolase [Peribacillus loiseleuriae]
MELIIQNGSNVYLPILKDEITWETERKGSPGILKFTVVKDQEIAFQEGNAVRLIINGMKIFYGFVFSKKRDKEQHIQVTAYDQLRYFKNKDTYVYSNKRADEVVKMIVNDFLLNVGTLENTVHKIASKIEDNKTLFDIVQSALDDTLMTKKKMYVLYDDFGKLALKDISKMKLDLLIDEETGENFTYSSSIDEQTYNKIKLSYENKEKGVREIYIAQHGANMNKWGVLQYFEKIDGNVNGKVKANALLELYNQRTRNLTINNALGDWRVRGGSLIAVILNLGDLITNNYMLVEKVKHSYRDDEHFMNLTLRGGEFIA